MGMSDDERAFGLDEHPAFVGRGIDARTGLLLFVLFLACLVVRAAVGA
jgi:hypothetical protein